MSNEGKVQLTGVVVAPPELVGEGERLWRSHAKWMQATHHRSGEKELLAYNVVQTPELDDDRIACFGPFRVRGFRLRCSFLGVFINT